MFKSVIAAAVPSVAAIALLSQVALSEKSSTTTIPTSGSAATGTKVGEFNASGLIFKDVVQVTAFPDPKIEGVTIHVSNVKRSIAERLNKDFFTDPSQTSVSASQTGPLRLLAPIALGPEGEEVFSARKNLFFKAMHVRRIYDEVNNAIVYVAYSTRPMFRYRCFGLSTLNLFDKTTLTPGHARAEQQVQNLHQLNRPPWSRLQPDEIVTQVSNESCYKLKKKWLKRLYT